MTVSTTGHGKANDELRAQFEELQENYLRIQQSERDFRSIIENMQDAFYRADTQGNLTMVNPSFIRELGYTGEKEVLGKNIAETFYNNPGDRDAFLRQLESTGKVSEYQLTLHRKDKSPVEARVSSHYFYSPDGRPAGIEGVIHNISDIVTAGTALRKSEENIRTILDNIPDLVLVHSNGIILYVNPAMIHTMGIRPEEVLKKPILDYIAPEYHRHVAAAIRKRIETGREEPYEIEILPRAGGRRVVLIRGSLIEFDGSPAILNVLTDVSDRKALERQRVEHEQELALLSSSLMQTNRKLNLMNAITRHDINNQLTILKSFLAFFGKEQPDLSSKREFRKITTAAERITAMIQFTKEYEQIGVHAPAWHNCRTLVGDAAKQAPPGHVVVKNDLPANAEVFSDPLIAKVFYNLIDNAIRYGRKITTIRFSLEVRDGDRAIVCEDDGDGIAPGEKEKIFERGFGKNTGLGLALSVEILSLTGITIRETGESGKGARFELLVPGKAFRTAS